MIDHRDGLDYRQNRVPDEYIKSFCSEKPQSSETTWVTCQFSPDVRNEHLLLVGDQDGHFFVIDVRSIDSNSANNFVRECIKADNSCILELEFVPNRPSHVISLSGHSNVRLWDFENSLCVYSFKGHEDSVRAISISPFNSDVFVTGSRDGTICAWDQRVAPDASKCRSPVYLLTDSHSSSNYQGSFRRKHRRLSSSSNRVGVTSLVYLDENMVASSSTSFKSGVRVWDMRYLNKKRPLRVLEIPQTRSAREFGVASLCVDRFRSSLFVACTDSSIYEYAVNSSKKVPISSLSGISKFEFRPFEVRLASSPVSEYLFFASGDNHGLIWDFQERQQSLLQQNDTFMEYFPYPKFVLGGHQTEVRMVRVSSCGQYIASLDDIHWRLWKFLPSPAISSNLSPGLERVEYFRLPESALDRLKMTQLSMSSDNESRRVRKRRIVSPFVSPSKPLNAEKFSPAAKMLKQRSSPFSPITNVIHERVCGLARRKLEFGGQCSENGINGRKNEVKIFFRMKHPTLDLPDFVKERAEMESKENCSFNKHFLKKFKRVLKGTMEDYIITGKQVSNCSKMVKALERKINSSPRKLVVKQRLQESAKIAAARNTPKTPHRETGVVSSKRKMRSSSMRTLENYFNKET